MKGRLYDHNASVRLNLVPVSAGESSDIYRRVVGSQRRDHSDEGEGTLTLKLSPLTRSKMEGSDFGTAGGSDGRGGSIGKTAAAGPGSALRPAPSVHHQRSRSAGSALEFYEAVR